MPNPPKRKPDPIPVWRGSGSLKRLLSAHRQLLHAAAEHSKPITVAIALLGLTATIFGAFEVTRREQQAAKRTFQLAAENRIAALEREVASNMAALSAFRSHLALQPPRTQQEFEQYANTLRTAYPSIRSLEYSPQISGQDRQRYEMETGLILKEGNPYREFYPAAKRDTYYPVRFMYPTAGVEKALGYDLFSCQSCKAAMLRALDTGKPVATGRLKLVEQTGDGYGVPIFQALDTHASTGFAMALLQVSDLTEMGLRHLRPEGIDVSVLDMSAPKDKQALYTHFSRLRPRNTPDPKLPETAVEPDWEVTKTFSVASRQWRLTCTPTPDYRVKAAGVFPLQVLFFGLLVTFGLSSYFYILVSHIRLSKNLVQSLRFTNNRLIDEVEERQRIQAQLAVARDSALETARLKSQFLANMSHEIRTPMNGLMGMTELVLDTELQPLQREYLQIVHDCGENLLQLLNNILDLSKIEAGGILLEHIPYCPEDVCQSIVRLLGRPAAEKGLTVTVRSSCKSQLLGDPSRLRQILTNLVSNAIKFTSNGSVTIDQQLQKRETGLWLRFEISDTGVGIAKHVQESLFKPFTQADASTTRQFGGTGLGLAICKELVELLHGTIAVQSELGAGSTFSFEIPVDEVPQVEEISSEARPAPLNEAFRGCRILVAEDNAVNQLVVSAALRKLGCAVELVSNGTEAVEKYRNSDFDIIFMDCQMPGVDGYDATRQIRSEESGPNRVPIIALTAHALSGDRERCLEAGMDDYLTKPLETSKLQAVLREFAITT